MEIVGWIGTILVIAAYYPQIQHLYKQKCAWGLSISTWTIWLIASGFLLAYALLRGAIIFVFVQCVSMLAIAATIFLARKSVRMCAYHRNIARASGS